MHSAPTLKYFVSDTFGSNAPDPTRSPIDADVHIGTDLAYLEGALEDGDADEIRALRGSFPVKINSRGREIALPRHLAGIMDNWHTEHADLLREHDSFNGFFSNYAPRTKEFRNGPPFYEAETSSGLRIVTTFPADVLWGIRDKVHALYLIPNEDNPLFGDNEQFRSKNVHRYLRKNHSFPRKTLSDGEANDTLENRHFGNGVDDNMMLLWFY